MEAGISRELPSYAGNGEQTALLPASPAACQVATSRTRFWILALFCAFSCLSCWQWNSWGPISESVGAAYPDWGSSRVALMANIGTGIFVVSVWPVCWAVERLGLRVSMLITCFLSTFALALRCFTQDPQLFTLLCTISSCILGVAMSMVLAVPPLIAVDWFPKHERTTAQAVIFSMEQLGLLVSYLEPLIVRLPGPAVSVAVLRDDISQLMYIGTGCSVVLSVACILYFPSRPAMPPSRAAAVQRMTLMQGVKTFVRSRQLWLLIVCYFACTGPAFGWLTVLNYSLLPLHFHQDESMWVAGAAIVISAAASLAAGHYTDKNSGHLRRTLVVLMLLSAASFYWFLLLFEGTIPFSKWQVYASVISSISLNFASIPVFYEMAQELAWLCPEVVVGGMLAFADNISATIFLLMYQLPSIGLDWVPYVLVASCALVVLPISCINVSYVRTGLDLEGRDPVAIDGAAAAAPPAAAARPGRRTSCVSVDIASTAATALRGKMSSYGSVVDPAQLC
uniref:Disrupted in renal carcinoma protein 2 homolog n=2 Tax=Hirondellea gigas TaxID=1518452 RepID=A0A6A7G7Q0_9CRUS